MKFRTNIFPALLLILLMVTSCGKTDPNQQIDEGKVTDESYHSEEIGWTIKIPKGFTIVSKEDRLKSEAKGKKAIAESSGQDVNTETLQHLISFRKNKFNNFASTSQPYEETTVGDYDAANAELCGVIYDTYIDQGMKVDTSTSNEVIQGLNFHRFDATIYNMSDGAVVLKQILFSRLINGYDFSVNINYNNEEDLNIMMKAFSDSKFETR